MSIHAVRDEQWAAPHVSRLLTLTGLDAQLPTFATLDAAVATPASGPSP